VDRVVRDEGFRLNQRKTAVQLSGGRQVLGGLVVNQRPKVSRAEVDRLKAVLHNCVRQGPSTQNREGRSDFRLYLIGRVGWVAQHDPVRGERLRGQLDRIDWSR
jgi:RNA-directed DNA polymerase